MTAEELRALADEVRGLSDRVAIGELIDRFSLTLDEGKFDQTWVGSLFTDDVRLAFPVGSHAGAAGLAEFTAEFMGRWDRTHHHAANYVITVIGDRASVTWNMIATHLPPGPPSGPHFQLGGYFDGSAVRTSQGWRFAELTLRVVWTRGRPAVSTIRETTER